MSNTYSDSAEESSPRKSAHSIFMENNLDERSDQSKTKQMKV